MKTYLDCIPCFFRQSLEAARLTGAGFNIQKKIIYDTAGALREFPLNSSPPEMARIIHQIIQRHTKNSDPYKKIKNKSNKMAMGLYPDLKKRVASSDNPLLTALLLAIAGNIIDYGARSGSDVEAELEKILKNLDTKKYKRPRKHFNYNLFENKFKKSKTILYLADNAGETVFDRVFIEEMKKAAGDKNIIYAVKEKPIINDALLEDALFCGIDSIADIISSGSDAPGTVLSLCSKEFIKIYKKADMVISKGQGNFEALSGVRREIFFLFIAKCAVIAKDANCGAGDIILKKSP